MTERCKRVSDVAELYGVTQQSVYQWIRAGKLGHLRLPGGQIRIQASDLEAFEAAQWQGPDSKPLTTSLSVVQAAAGPSVGPRAVNLGAFQRGQRTASKRKSS